MGGSLLQRAGRGIEECWSLVSGVFREVFVMFDATVAQAA